MNNVVRLPLGNAQAPRDPFRSPGAAVMVHHGSITPGRGMDLHIRQLSKRYHDVAALEGVDLDIASGELVALLGPSGSGKTTLLRVIGGLLHADRGQVLFGDKDATRLSLR